jgi:hypothetical protein
MPPKKEVKKRGRKPKNKTAVPKTINEDNETVMIHLALSKDDVNDVLPEEDDSDKKINGKKKKSLLNEQITNRTTNLSKKKKKSCDDDCEKCQEYQRQIDDLNKKLADVTGIDNTMEERIMESNVKFIDSITNKKIKWKTTTDIACWHCTETFDSMPCVAPDRYVNEKYFVFGCFCSFNCVLTYILKMSDHRVWERIALLHHLLFDLFGEDKIISPAPIDIRVLTKFGGVVGIEQFRKGSVIWNKDYKYIIPPMTPIIPLIEETKSGRDMNAGIKAKEKLKGMKLRRSKPIVEENSLMRSMGITAQ